MGVYHGEGKLLEANGSEYYGDFLEGKKDGDGSQKTCDGTYTGHWKLG
jgi:hypothetical protein